MLAEDVALDDPRLGRFRNVAHSGREDGIAVVGPAVLGEEADEALLVVGGVVSGAERRRAEQTVLGQ